MCGVVGADEIYTLSVLKCVVAVCCSVLRTQQSHSHCMCVRFKCGIESHLLSGACETCVRDMCSCPLYVPVFVRVSVFMVCVYVFMCMCACSKCVCACVRVCVRVSLYASVCVAFVRPCESVRIYVGRGSRVVGLTEQRTRASASAKAARRTTFATCGWLSHTRLSAFVLKIRGK